MTRREYMRDYMRARRQPVLHKFARRAFNVGSAIDPTADDEARRKDAEQGSRALLERINALLERREQ